jgi:hypothetical protein
LTNYIVFVKHAEEDDGRQMWQPFTAQVAHSDRDAIRKSLEGTENPFGSGEYAAVPVRSWRPVKVAVETARTVDIATEAPREPSA